MEHPILKIKEINEDRRGYFGNRGSTKITLTLDFKSPESADTMDEESIIRDSYNFVNSIDDDVGANHAHDVLFVVDRNVDFVTVGHLLFIQLHHECPLIDIFEVTRSKFIENVLGNPFQKLFH